LVLRRRDKLQGVFFEMSSSTLDAPPPSVARAKDLLAKEQVVVDLFDAFSSRRLADALPLLTDDVVFVPMTARVTQAGEPYRGHDGMRRYFSDVEAQWTQLTLRPTQIKAAGNAVVALGLVSGSGAAGSFESAPTTWMFKFRGERVASIQIFSDAAHVLEALGEAAT
jgi:ketosteroid isomerase-like protein